MLLPADEPPPTDMDLKLQYEWAHMSSRWHVFPYTFLYEGRIQNFSENRVESVGVVGEPLRLHPGPPHLVVLGRVWGQRRFAVVLLAACSQPVFVLVLAEGGERVAWLVSAYGDVHAERHPRQMILDQHVLGLVTASLVQLAC